MVETQNQKIEELLDKIKTLGNRAKEVRSSFGQPVQDRLLDRLNKLSSRLPQHNGGSNPQQQLQTPQVPKLVCPKCGQSFVEDISFCSGCGFDFSAEKRRQLKEGFEREKLERNSRMGVIAGG
ncbi:hypothetical protein MUP01_07585 [Candidatus Bathyarchaeota archaeon]|nr:hypothetical protein [Candidatus Bathyarchaeota archaeon]